MPDTQGTSWDRVLNWYDIVGLDGSNFGRDLYAGGMGASLGNTLAPPGYAFTLTSVKGWKNPLGPAYRWVLPVGGTHTHSSLRKRSLLAVSSPRHTRHRPSKTPQRPLSQLTTFGLKCQQPGCLTQNQASGRGCLPFLLNGQIMSCNHMQVADVKTLTKSLYFAPD